MNLLINQINSPLNQKSVILVTFKPTLSDEAIREEAQRLHQTVQGLELKVWINQSPASTGEVLRC